MLRVQDLAVSQQAMLKGLLALQGRGSTQRAWQSHEIYKHSGLEKLDVSTAARKGSSILKTLEKRDLVKSLFRPGHSQMQWQLTQAGAKIWG